MFMLISLVNKKSDFSEKKHLFNKNNLRKGYGGVFHAGIFLGWNFPQGNSPGGFEEGEFSAEEFDVGEFFSGEFCGHHFFLIFSSCYVHQ